MAAAGLTGRFTVTPDSVMTATITGVRETDDGDYRCASGPSEIIHKLVIYKLNSVNIQPSGPVTGYVGGTFDVTCTADSKPAASFNWTKQEDSSFTATGATLRISSLTMNHTGTYVCTAYHAYDSDTASVQLTVNELQGQDVTSAPRTGEPNVGGIVGGVIGALAGVAVMAAVVFFVIRKKRAGGDKKDGDVEDLSDRQYENVPNPMMASQRPGSGSDEYEIPMETVQSPTGSANDEYEVPMETVQPPQPSDDYQELRPAVYQSLQR
ncbi:PREDICTED: protein SLG1-like [Branchiostoma belcheri]|uniref:Protein SLG1-like n=1 Tax=Branchiostoma belcheri TaxID=7741 RepID=A0A6P4YDI5_BRABE|nr:PREDICTED: protein SLG1-like [Branchiostoma belcheri]